jgi:bifunctional DNA-binding transcriptional regulator/antitoxin component of YhaV-PrlF toxin-antitoxin module
MVVALPPDWLRFYGIEKGDKVEILHNNVVIVKPLCLKLTLDILMRDLRAFADPRGRVRESEKCKRGN